MCFRDAAMLTSACLTLVIWSSMSSYDRSSISSGRSAASSALLALALTMSWARWKRDIPACFLSATACTCRPASTLRRPAPGPRWPAAPRRGRDCQLRAAAPWGAHRARVQPHDRRLRVEVTYAGASYALADGGPLEIVHPGQPGSLTAGKPQAPPIPAASSRPASRTDQDRRQDPRQDHRIATANL